VSAIAGASSSCVIVLKHIEQLARIRVMTSSSRTPDDTIDRLIAQVGRLTEAITVGFHDSREEFQNFRGELAELKEITKQQTENTARLVRIVEMLIQKNEASA